MVTHNDRLEPYTGSDYVWVHWRLTPTPWSTANVLGCHVSVPLFPNSK